MAHIREWLEQHDIILAGRYSEWEYYNSDHAFIAGKKAAERVMSLEERKKAVASEGWIAASGETEGRRRGWRNWAGRMRRAIRRVALQGHPDGLHVGILLDRIGAEVAAEAALLISSEGAGRVEGVVAVDPDGAGFDLGGDAVGELDVARPDGGGKAVDGAVRDADGLVDVEKRMALTTGPKISSRAIFISGRTSEKTVGLM